MRRLLRLAAIAAACSAGTSACKGPTDSGDTGPDVLEVASGNGQSGQANLLLPQALSVKVTSSDGRPLPGIAVEWAVTSGGGSIAGHDLFTNAGGISVATWKLGEAGWTQRVSAKVSGAIPSEVSFTATAMAMGGPLVLRYDGTAWRTDLADSNSRHIRLSGIWGASVTDVFAVGSVCLHRSGGGWAELPSCLSGLGPLTSVSGRSTSDVFVARRWALPPSGGTDIWHYDGQSWAMMYGRECSFDCFSGYNSVWASPGVDVFAVGDAGMTLHYDGSSWKTLTSGTTASLNGVWGAASDKVFAVGADGTILFYDGTSWRTQTSGVSETLNGVWGTSASDVFAVGNHGTMLRYDGAQWSRISIGTTEDLFALTVSSGHLFGVGNNSTIVQYDGATWSVSHASAAIDLRGVWAASPTQVFAVGTPR